MVKACKNHSERGFSAPRKGVDIQLKACKPPLLAPCLAMTVLRRTVQGRSPWGTEITKTTERQILLPGRSIYILYVVPTSYL